VASYAGIADGAQSNWDFLAPHTATQILDFYHAAQYLADAAAAAFPRDKAQREQWHTERCHDLKRILKEMQGLSQQRLSESIQGELEAAIT
jgi:predicted dienelactone hydrolase